MHSSMAYYDVDGNELPHVDNDPRMRYCVRKGVKIDWLAKTLLPQIAEGKILIGATERDACYCWLECKQYSHGLTVRVHEWKDAGGFYGWNRSYFQGVTLNVGFLNGIEQMALVCTKTARQEAQFAVQCAFKEIQKNITT